MRIVCGSWCKLAHRYIARIAKWLDFPDIIPIPPSPISRLIFPPLPWDFARMKRRVSFNFCPSRETQIHTLTIKKYYKFTCFFNNNNEIDKFLLINRRTFVYLVQRRKSRLFLPNYDQKNRRNEANETRRRSNVSSILDVHSFPLPLPTIPSKKPYVSTDPIFILGRRKRVQDRDRQRKRERRAIRFEATQ